MRLLLPLLLLTVVISPPLALASDSALSASPAILETVLKPGFATTTTLMIQNNTNFPLPIKGSAAAFLSTESTQPTSEDRFNASKWFALDPADFILQPNELKKVTITITPPSNAEPGGHYATIYFRPLIPQEIVSSNTTSLARIGVLALMLVPGDMTESLAASPLRGPSFQAFGPVKYWYSLTNQGNIHLLPTIKLTIKNIFGKTVYEKQNDPSLILPTTTKEYNQIWQTQLGFGVYTASVTTNYGTSHPALVSNQTITYLIPWPIILIIILILTFIYKVFIVNRKRLMLALRVLRGQYELPQITQENSRQYPGTLSRTHASHQSSLKRSPRR